MKRSWLRIVGIVVAGLATTSGCGSNQNQTADATGSSAGPGAGQYSPPPSAPSQGSMGGGFGDADDSDDGSGSSVQSGYGGPPSGSSSSGTAGSGAPPYGAGYGAATGYGGGGPGTPSMGDIGGYGIDSGYGGSGGAGASPYGAGYGAATGYGGGRPGAAGVGTPGSEGPGGVTMGASSGYGTAPSGPGYGYGTEPGGNVGGMAGGAGSIGGMGGNSGLPSSTPSAPRKLSMQDRAKLAFQAGNYSRAYELAYAHGLMSSDAEAMTVASAYRAAPTKSRPALGIQVAVGLILQKPDGLTDLKPIGTDWESITGSSGNGLGAGMSGPGMYGSGTGGIGMPGMGGAETSSPPGAKALTDAAGALATDFIDAFKELHGEGKWSVYFQAEEFKGRALATGQPGMGQPGMGGFGEGMGGYGTAPGMGGMPGAGGVGLPGGGIPGGGFSNSGGPGAPGGALQFRRQSGQGIGIGLGGAGDDGDDGPGISGIGLAGPGSGGVGAGSPGGAVGDAGYGTPPNMGGYGTAPGMGGYGAAPGMGGYGPAPGMGGYGGAPGMGGLAGSGGAAGVGRPTIDPADVRLDRSITPLAPCLHYIGTGDTKSLMESAYEGGYDVLVLFEVEVTQNRRNNVVTNTAFIRCLIPADTPKNAENIIKSKPLVNRDVAQARRKKENDGVSDVVKSVLRKLTERAALQPIPEKLTPDFVINKRLPAILESEKMSTLCKLSEINFYYHKGYLDEAQRSDFFERIAGELANDILSEDLELRESAILELLNS